MDYVPKTMDDLNRERAAFWLVRKLLGIRAGEEMTLAQAEAMNALITGEQRSAYCVEHGYVWEDQLAAWRKI